MIEGPPTQPPLAVATVDIPDAARYDIELDIDETSVRRALAIDPTDVEPADALTFARNVFIPLTTACRYTCTYCTFYDPPGQARLLSTDQVREIVQTGIEAGCSEALFTLGDEPDTRYKRINAQLKEWGFPSIHAYLGDVCELALKEGLLPHSNPGDQTMEQMRLIAPYNASMGVMLETTAEVQAHAGPRGKSPAQRLATIRTAGELDIAFTTGILVGIGESMADRATSLLAIGALHERYGHIQEVIVQPVVENDRWRGGSPDLDTLRTVVAMARGILPDEVSVQVPPNLAPVRDLLDCGIDDLGGVSPVTVDHVNPAYAWPALDELEAIATVAGVPLRERLPVYGRFLPSNLETGESRFLTEPIRQALTADTSQGKRYREILYN